MVAIKRNADRLFYSIAPLFSVSAVEAYHDFLDQCFSTYGRWGADARIRSGFIRRREAAGEAWRAEWDDLFTHQVGEEITESGLTAIQTGYNNLLAALVEDVQLLAPRDRYADGDVVINAH